jgi:stage II sporulation protein D
MPCRRLLLPLVLVAVAFGSAGASAQTPPAPVSVTTFVISGRGWGHGVGMGQWGAYGYAKHGWTYDKILAHYYPGTTLAPTGVLRINVLLVEQAAKVIVSSPDPFTVKGADGVAHPLPGGNYALDSTLTLTVKDQPPLQLAAPLTFAPGKSPLWLRNPYRGTFVVRPSGKFLSVVNSVPIEAYVRGVVSSEMPRDWPLEAVKAQAVAARSYALAHRRGDLFDVYNDTRDQVYGGIAAETPVGDAAAAGTKRQVLLYDGKPAQTFFFSSSGGRTANVTDAFADSKPIPYLVSVPDPYDTYAPYHTWGPVPVAAAALSQALAVPGITGLRPVPAAGHARAFVLDGSKGEVTMPSGPVRRALGVRSTWLSKVGVLSLSRPPGLVAAGSTVTITGRASQVDSPVLEQQPAGQGWQPGPALTIQPDGTFSVSVTPSVTTQYRLGTGTIKSAILRVAVAQT